MTRCDLLDWLIIDILRNLSRDVTKIVGEFAERPKIYPEYMCSIRECAFYDYSEKAYAVFPIQDTARVHRHLSSNYGSKNDNLLRGRIRCPGYVFAKKFEKAAQFIGEQLARGVIDPYKESQAIVDIEYKRWTEV